MPPRLLWERGLLRAGDRYFDYGCGHGLDLTLLQNMGITAHGWDPAHRPGNPKMAADVVHCGYVLNVIEDPAERRAIIADAWSLAERVLSIAVRIRAADSLPTGVPYGDGELTRTGTFQRYYEADELPPLLEEALGFPVLAIAPGIAIVARDEAIIQEALAQRQRRSVATPDIASAPKQVAFIQNADAPVSSTPDSETPSVAAAPSRVQRLGPRQARIQALIAAVSPDLSAFGRPPKSGEWEPPPEAQALGLSSIQVWNAYAKHIGSQALTGLANQRRSEVLVYLAMAHFRRVRGPAEPPIRIKNDIELLCGGRRSAAIAAKECLLEAGDPAVISKLCDNAGIGVCDEQALYIHNSLFQRLHPVLRVYVACAEILGAPIQSCDIIKIHKRSRKITLLIYQEFTERPLPALIERIKVDLRSRKVMVFDHRSQPRQLLYDKDLYVDQNHPRRLEWQTTCEKITSLLGPMPQFGFNHIELREKLRSKNESPDVWAPENFPAPTPDDFDADL